jgi:hypothetical protein
MNARLAVLTFTVLGLAIAVVAVTTPTSTEAGPAPANLTVLLKNSDFPLKARMTVEPCAAAACIEI